MNDIREALDNLQTPALAADANMIVFYANDCCKTLFKNVLEQEDFVGRHMEACHPPEAFEKLKQLYADFQAGSKTVSHYVRDLPDGKITVVQVPIFKEGKFAGAMEYIFAGSLA